MRLFLHVFSSAPTLQWPFPKAIQNWPYLVLYRLLFPNRAPFFAVRWGQYFPSMCLIILFLIKDPHTQLKILKGEGVNLGKEIFL